jgi:hypothetical protein
MKLNLSTFFERRGKTGYVSRTSLQYASVYILVLLDI